MAKLTPTHNGTHTHAVTHTHTHTHTHSVGVFPPPPQISAMPMHRLIYSKVLLVVVKPLTIIMKGQFVKGEIDHMPVATIMLLMLQN